MAITVIVSLMVSWRVGQETFLSSAKVSDIYVTGFMTKKESKRLCQEYNAYVFKFQDRERGFGKQERRCR